MHRIKFLGLDIYGCHEALARLDDYIDRELSPEETHKVQQHLRICRECAHKFASEAELVAAIKSRVQAIHLPIEVGEFQTRVDALLRAQSAPRAEENAGDAG